MNIVQTGTNHGSLNRPSGLKFGLDNVVTWCESTNIFLCNSLDNHCYNWSKSKNYKSTRIYESLSIGRPGDTGGTRISESTSGISVSAYDRGWIQYRPNHQNRNPKFFLILHFQKQTEKNRMSPNLTIQYLERILII